MIRYNTLLISILSFCCFSLHAEKSMEQQISEYIDGKDARIGVAVIVDGADTIAVNRDEGFSHAKCLQVSAGNRRSRLLHAQRYRDEGHYRHTPVGTIGKHMEPAPGQVRGDTTAPAG